MKPGFCFFVFLMLQFSGSIFGQSENPENVPHLDIGNGFYLVLEEASESNQLKPPSQDELILPYTLEHLGVSGQPARYFRVKSRPDVPFALEDKPVVGDKVEGKTTLNMVLGTGSSEMFRKFTAANIDKTVAIIVAGKVVTAHKIRCEISGGAIQITRCGDDACQTLYFWLKDAVKK
jgi:hypothetical protein